MYKITIEKTTTKSVTKRGEYTTIDQRPWKLEEVDESGYRIQDLPALKNIIGYAPDFQGVEEEKSTIYTQQVEEMNLPGVIKAINGLK